jgi:hypothetical protein
MTKPEYQKILDDHTIPMIDWERISREEELTEILQKESPML